jgi:hypothetical protein
VYRYVLGIYLIIKYTDFDLGTLVSGYFWLLGSLAVGSNMMLPLSAAGGEKWGDRVVWEAPIPEGLAVVGLALFTLFSPELGLWVVGTFHVILQSQHQLMTSGMVHVTNLAPGSDSPKRWTECRANPCACCM